MSHFRLREPAPSALDGGPEARKPMPTPTQELYAPSLGILPAVAPVSYSKGRVVNARLGPAPTQGAGVEEF